MTTVAWATDLHLNIATAEERQAFLGVLEAEDADILLLAGDIGDGALSRRYLREMAEAFGKPIYFVMGNHDYYGSSIGATRALAHLLCAENEQLTYLTGKEIIPLTETVCLVGHDGWSDGRCGDFFGSDIVLNDYCQIRDFRGLEPDALLKELKALGSEASRRLAHAVWEAFLRFDKVVVLTHVPPFRQACCHHGEIADDNWAPHFVCQAVGDVLEDMMETFSSDQMVVLCGHAHSGAEVMVKPNLRVIAGNSDLGKPALQERFCVTERVSMNIPGPSSDPFSES